MPRLDRHDALIHYDVRGDGPVVLLTHGFSSSGDAFAGNAAAIVNAGCRLVTWDLRGHGRTDAGTDAESYTVSRVLGDMAALLDHVGADRAVVGGHSLGGYLSLAFRIAHPDRVEGLILLDTGPGYRDDTARAGWNRFVDKEVRRLADEQPGIESAGWTLTAENILKQHDASVIESLPAIDVPVLVIVGEKDKPFRGGSAYMADKIPDAELVVIDGAGHSPNVTHKEEFDRCVTKFLARVVTP
jgi:pimeloyl-ACP methyl ester carboxylesterase